MAIQHVSPNTDIDVILDIIERDAAVVIDDVLNEKDLDDIKNELAPYLKNCLLYTSPSPRDVEESRMPSSA